MSAVRVEIDIFEPVNLQTTNQFALHTTEGYVQPQLSLDRFPIPGRPS